MTRIPSVQDISNVQTWEELRRYAGQVIGDLLDLVNGRIEVGSNLDLKSVDVTFPASGTNVAVKHGLRRIPKGYIVVKSTAAVQVYNGSGDSSDEIINLKANGAATVTVLIF